MVYFLRPREFSCFISSKSNWTARGTIPSFSEPVSLINAAGTPRESGSYWYPSMEKVLPEPVYPYAKIVELYP